MKTFLKAKLALAVLALSFVSQAWAQEQLQVGPPVLANFGCWRLTNILEIKDEHHIRVWLTQRRIEFDSKEVHTYSPVLSISKKAAIGDILMGKKHQVFSVGETVILTGPQPYQAEPLRVVINDINSDGLIKTSQSLCYIGLDDVEKISAAK
jgi:hypothetical protein